MSDSRRCSSWKYAWKKLQKFIRARAHRQKCSAPIQCQAMLISHFELHILPKSSKTVSILAKAHENEFWVNILTQRKEFADFREINRAKTWVGASVSEHFWRCALPRINVCNFVQAYFQNHSFPQPVYQAFKGCKYFSRLKPKFAL
jgi:hypothetical protein